MSDQELAPLTALDGYTRDFNGTVLREVTDLAIVSIAIPLDGKPALAKAVKSAYGCALPKPAMSSLTKDGTTRLVSSQADQALVLFDHPSADGGVVVSKKLGDAGYYTDQSDNWTALSLSGPQTRTALERICPIDLDPKAFPVNASARTHMEHLGVLIICIATDAFLLLSARSSAKSFLHAVEVSVKNVG